MRLDQKILVWLSCEAEDSKRRWVNLRCTYLELQEGPQYRVSTLREEIHDASCIENNKLKHCYSIGCNQACWLTS